MAENKIVYVSPERLGYYDSKIKSHIATADEAIRAALQANIDAANKVIGDEETRAKAAELTNAQAAAVAQKSADDLEAYVGTFTASEGVDTVVKYIDAKTANIASDETVSALDERVTQAEKDIDAIEADYLKAADKTELSNAISAEAERAAGIEGGLRTDVDAIKGDYLKEEDKTELQGNIDAVSAVANAAVKQSDYDTKVAALEDEDERIAGLVSAEAERAAGVEESLQTQINTIMNNPDAEGAINSINEFTQYVKDHGTIADGFRTDIDQNKEDIAANKKSIEDHMAEDHDFAAADATLKSELEGKINAKADASTVSDMDIAYKAADKALQKALEAHTALNHDFATADAAIKSALEGQIALKADTTALNAVSEKVTALENANKEGGAVAQAIASADAKAAQAQQEVDALEEVVATKAAQADLEAATGRITTAEGEIDTLQSEMDAVEAKAAANENAISTLSGTVDTKASKTDLESAVNRIIALEEVKHEQITEAQIDAWFEQA